MFPAWGAAFQGVGRGVNRTLRSLPVFRNRPEESYRIADRDFPFDGRVSADFTKTDATALVEFALRVVRPGFPPPVAWPSYNHFAAPLRASCSAAVFTPVTDSIDSAWHLSFSCSAVAFTADTGSGDDLRHLLFRISSAVPSALTDCRGFCRARLSTARASCDALQRRDHAICRLFSEQYIFIIHALPRPGRSLPASTACRSGRHPAITLKSL